MQFTQAVKNYYVQPVRDFRGKVVGELDQLMDEMSFGLLHGGRGRRATEALAFALGKRVDPRFSRGHLHFTLSSNDSMRNISQMLSNCTRAKSTL